MKGIGRQAWLRRLFLSFSGASLLASSCSLDRIQAIASSIEEVASELNGEEEDVNFGDWLASELND